MPHVLLIEDDARIRDIVERGLSARGFRVSTADDASSGVDLARELEIDLVLLDLVLPERSGLETLEDLRVMKPRLPVIALTALAETSSKIGGLNAGVDDYVTKPFSVEELAARIRARLRWADDGTMALRAGPLTVDLAAHRVLLDNREIHLSGREVALLVAFIRNPGQVLSRGRLLETVWNVDFDPGSNIVEVYVAALRRKLGASLIETVRGVGYRFVIPEADPNKAGAT